MLSLLTKLPLYQSFYHLGFPQMLPFSVVGRLVTVVDELKVSEGDATVTEALWALSPPVQLDSVGATVYFQVPPGTDDSVQVVADTVPEHALPIVCAFPFVS